MNNVDPSYARKPPTTRFPFDVLISATVIAIVLVLLSAFALDLIGLVNWIP